MKKSITKNYIYNLIYQILILILPFITAPYISRVLGAENIGIYSYTTSVSAFFILFGSMGTALYGQREIAFYQNDRKQYSKIFWEIVFLRGVAISSSIIIFYFTFARSGQYAIYYKILILEIIGNCIDISWFFQGMEDFKKTVIRNTIIKIISVVCIFIFVKSRNDLYIYLWIFILSVLLGNLSLWLYLPKYLTKIKIKEVHILKHLKPTIILFLPQIALQVYTILDKVMIGNIIADKSEVGYYEQSQKIIKILLTIEGSFGTVMMPRMANSFASNNKEKIKRDIVKSFSMAFMLAFPMIVGVCIVSDKFVPIYYGEGYESVALLIKVISPIVFFIGISGCIGYQYLLPTKRQKEYTISVVIGAITNLLINAILINKMGALGASIATVIAECAVAVCQLVFIRNSLNIKKILKIGGKYAVASIVMFIVCILIDSLKINTYISIALDVFVGAITYIIVLMVLKDDFIMQIVNKLLNKVGIRRTK